MRSNPSSSENAVRLVQYVLKHADPELAKRLSVKRFVGSGTFSNVFHASLFVPLGDETIEVEVAVKHLLNFNSPTRLQTELNFLNLFGGQASIATVFHACTWEGHLLLVLPYIDCEDFEVFIESPPSTNEIIEYLSHLLQSLAVLHKHNVIHRDIKPANFLISKLSPGSNKRNYLLIDFGLSEKELQFKKPKRFKKVADSVTSSGNNRSITSRSISPNVSSLQSRRSCLSSRTNKHIEIDDNTSRSSSRSPSGNYKLSSTFQCECMGESKTCSLCHGNTSTRPLLKGQRRAGTAGFRPPEVLMRTNVQTTSMDIWCCGVILLSIITGKFPFFHGKGGDDQSLSEITTIFGVKMMQECSNILGRNFISNCASRRMKLKSLCNALRYNLGNVQTVYNETVCGDNQCYHAKLRRKRVSSKQDDRFINSASKITRAENTNASETSFDQSEKSRSQTAVGSVESHSHNVGHVSDSGYSEHDIMSSDYEMLVDTNESGTSCTENGCLKQQLPYPDSLYHLLIELLDVNPFTRITAEDALKHPFMQEVKLTKDFLQNYQEKKRQKQRSNHSS